MYSFATKSYYAHLQMVLVMEAAIVEVVEAVEVVVVAAIRYTLFFTSQQRRNQEMY
jgi:hypothetical protein